LGAVLIFFFKKDKIRDLGNVILGFGLIFLGLVLMDMAIDFVIEEHEEFIKSSFAKLSDMPELGVFVGILFTMLVQSSAATISIVQDLFASGAMQLGGALALMLGANIGTTITAIIASLGSSKAAKKVAMANTLIKTIGVLVFVIIFRFAFYPLIELIYNNTFLKISSDPNPMIISLSHLGFNIINSFALLLLIKPFVKLCDKLMPDKSEKTIEEQLLDYSLIQKSPQLALSFAKKSIDYMVETVNEFFKIAKSYSFNRDDSLIDKGLEYERTINLLDKRIHDYLIKLTISALDDKSSNKLSKYLDLIKDMERVGDHCTNLFEFFKERYDKEMHLSQDGVQDLDQMYTTVGEMLEGTYQAVVNWSPSIAQSVIPLEDETDRLEEVLHERHIHRVQSGACSFINTEHYVEVLSNLERIGDHLNNTLESILYKEYEKGSEYNH
jgi:phosphate:Na+ symporter